MPRTAARPAPKRQHRTPLQNTRAEHAQETAQDYVEMIADLISENGEARVTDLARRFGITHVTVNKTLRRLQREGLVVAEPYQAIALTGTGSRLSEESRARHLIVVALLKSLGVSEETAQADAEGMEHHVSAETLAAFRKHLASGG